MGGQSSIEAIVDNFIAESDFNRTVGLLINAMNKANIAQPLQNRLLAKLAHKRSDMIYR